MCFPDIRSFGPEGLKVFYLLLGLGPAMSLDHSDDDVNSLSFQLMGIVKHLICFTNTGAAPT